MVKNMDAFISYSSNDREKVIRLVKELQTNGLSVWFDEDQIYPGDDLIARMRDGITECKHYVLCLSPSFEKKPPQSWVKQEMKMAMLKEHSRAENCIVPVRIKSGGALPIELGGRAYADLSNANRWAKNMAKLTQVLKSKT
jgi:hypothetical protein